MVTRTTPKGMAPFVVRLRPVIELSADQFYVVCQDNPDSRLELSERGELLIMPPTGGETGRLNLRLAEQLSAWARRDKTGVAFDSSTGFALPNEAVRSPDLAWVRRDRWEALSEESRQKFIPLAPDFALELRSPSDRLSDLQAKMAEYMASGTLLGWLIDPLERRVYVYSADKETQCLEEPTELGGDPVLPGFTLDLAGIL